MPGRPPGWSRLAPGIRCCLTGLTLNSGRSCLSLMPTKEHRMSEPKMIATKDGATGWLTFSNPERHNAVSYEMWQAIPGHIADFVADPAIRVIVLRGDGDRAFVSGADISQFENRRG